MPMVKLRGWLAWEAEPGDHAGSGDYGEDMWCLGVCLGCVKGEG